MKKIVLIAAALAIPAAALAWADGLTGASNFFPNILLPQDGRIYGGATSSSAGTDYLMRASWGAWNLVYQNTSVLQSNDVQTNVPTGRMVIGDGNAAAGNVLFESTDFELPILPSAPAAPATGRIKIYALTGAGTCAIVAKSSSATTTVGSLAGGGC
jgi:hypothetical protein